MGDNELDIRKILGHRVQLLRMTESKIGIVVEENSEVKHDGYTQGVRLFVDGINGTIGGQKVLGEGIELQSPVSLVTHLFSQLGRRLGIAGIDRCKTVEPFSVGVEEIRELLLAVTQAYKKGSVHAMPVQLNGPIPSDLLRGIRILLAQIAVVLFQEPIPPFAEGAPVLLTFTFKALLPSLIYLIRVEMHVGVYDFYAINHGRFL